MVADTPVPANREIGFTPLPRILTQQGDAVKRIPLNRYLSSKQKKCYGLLLHRINTKTTMTTPRSAANEGPGHLELSAAANAVVAGRSRVAVIRLLNSTISHLHHITYVFSIA